MNKKGFILIVSYIVLLVTLIAAGALFSRAIYEAKLAQRLQDDLRARDMAEYGLSCAFYEMRSVQWNWATHIENTDGTVQPKAVQPTRNVSGAQYDSDKNYYVTGNTYTGISKTFKLKSYFDLQNPNVIVTLCRATSGAATKVIEYQMATVSMFDYFFFSPSDMVFNAGYYSAGRQYIHSNGNIELRDNVMIESAGRLRAVGYIYYGINPATPSSEAGTEPYIYWGSDYTSVPDDEKYGYHTGDNYAYSGAVINNTSIPSTFDDAPYLRNRWLWTSGGYPGGALADAPSPDYDTACVVINSREQPFRWRNFVTSNVELNQIMRDGTMGGYERIQFSNIRSRFWNLRTGGLYLSDNVAGGGKVPSQLGSVGSDSDTYNNRVAKWVPYWNARTDPTSGGTYNPTYVVEIDIAKLRVSGFWPRNGVIYSEYPLRLTNAQELTSGGLTVYSQYAIELKGDYNIINKQPSCVIAEQGVYTLSAGFESDPDVDDGASGDNTPHLRQLVRDADKALYPQPNSLMLLPDSVHNLEYPFNPDVGLDETYMPNIVSANTIYNVAILTGADVTGYELERWRWGATQRKKTINGAFIRTPKYNTNVLTSIPIYRRGRSNAGEPFYYTPSTKELNYELSFVTTKPPGDLICAYLLSQKEIDVSDF